MTPAAGATASDGHDERADRGRPAPLTTSQYLAYAGGDVANNLTFTLVSMFLLVYYTDVVGIAAGAAGTILLVARVWGAFTDVFAGRFVDRTRTRWGRFRPFFIAAGVPLMVIAVGVFSVPGGLSPTATLVYAYASYMLFSLVYSLVNIPFGSLAAAMTQLPDERAKLSSARSIGAATAIIGLAIVVAPQITRSADLQQSLTTTTAVFAVLGTGLYVFLFARSREAVVASPDRGSLRESLRGVRRNGPLLMLCLSALLVLTGLFVLQTMLVYYARDVLGSADYVVLLTILTTGAMFVVSPLVPRIVRTMGKRRAYVVAGLVAMAGAVVVAFVPPTQLVWPLVGFTVYGIGIAAVQALMWALQADTVDYGEWRSGTRSEGINYAALSFSRKVGQGIGGAVAAFGIGVGGYVAGASTQSAEAQEAIRYVTGLGPAVFVGLGALLMITYPLTEQRFQQVVGELTRRHRTRALAGEAEAGAGE